MSQPILGNDSSVPSLHTLLRWRSQKNMGIRQTLRHLDLIQFLFGLRILVFSLRMFKFNKVGAGRRYKNGVSPSQTSPIFPSGSQFFTNTMNWLNQIISEGFTGSGLTRFHFFSRTSPIIFLYVLNEILSSVVHITNRVQL